MDYNRLDKAVYEIINWLPYDDIIRFCRANKELSSILKNEYFYQQYLLINYDIKRSTKQSTYSETMKITYEVLKVMQEKDIIVSKGLLGEIIQNSTSNDLSEFKTKLALIGEPGFLDIQYGVYFTQPLSIFYMINTPGDTQYADQYASEISKIDPTEMDEKKLKAKLFSLVDKYMTMPTEYIVDINTIKTIPYDRDFWPYICDDKFEKQLLSIQEYYEHHDIYYYRYFS